MKLSVPDQLQSIDGKGLGQTLKRIDGRRILLPLDHADIIAVEPGEVGELLLRAPALPPQPIEKRRKTQ